MTSVLHQDRKVARWFYALTKTRNFHRMDILQFSGTNRRSMLAKKQQKSENHQTSIYGKIAQWWQKWQIKTWFIVHDYCCVLCEDDWKNIEAEWIKKGGSRKADFLSVGEVHKSILWHSPGLTRQERDNFTHLDKWWKQHHVTSNSWFDLHSPKVLHCCTRN